MKPTLLAAAVLLTLSTVVQAEMLYPGQMADLIMEGRFTGQDQAQYDVWIVPGYQHAGKTARQGWRAAGSDLAEYGDADHYRNISEVSKSVMRFGGKDMIGDFALSGTHSAWSDAMETAGERVDRRVFGWPLAYPWGVLTATGESALRLIIGVPGGVLVTAGGATVVPVATFFWPAAKSVYHAGVEGTVFPVVSAGWNTLIAPPMALIGQQPTASSADGFWLTRLDPANSDANVNLMRTWAAGWTARLQQAPDVKVVADQRQKALANFNAKREQVLKTLREEEAAIRNRYLLAHEQAVLSAGESMPPEGTERDNLDKVASRHGREPIVKALQDHGISKLEAEKLSVQVLGPAGADAVEKTAPQRQPDQKTDVLQESLKGLQR